MKVALVLFILFLYIQGCYYKYIMFVSAAMIQFSNVSPDDELIRRNAVKIVKEHWYEILF